MASEHQWEQARAGFAAADAEARAAGRLDYPGGAAVPDGGMGGGPLGEQFAALGHALLEDPAESGVLGVLTRITEVAHRFVPEADLVSITVRTPDGAFHTPVETDKAATAIDAVQYDTGQGPCLDAIATPGPGVIASSDLAREPRWPDFGPRAAALGAAAVFSTGMFPGGDPPRLASLNYYSQRAGGLATVNADTALLLAAHAAVVLHAARRIELAELRTTQLTSALESRDVIGQAKGILMERRGCSAEEAFDVLRRASQELNVKLRDIAATLAEHRHQL